MQKLPSEASVVGIKYWAEKGDVKLFMWNKFVPDIPVKKGVIVFVHVSSMASQPTFDLYVDGRSFSSTMNCFACLGYDNWCVDMEGYGRFLKHCGIMCEVANGLEKISQQADCGIDYPREDNWCQIVGKPRTKPKEPQ